MGAVYDRSLLFEDLLKFADVLFQFSGRYAFFPPLLLPVPLPLSDEGISGMRRGL